MGRRSVCRHACLAVPDLMSTMLVLATCLSGWTSTPRKVGRASGQGALNKPGFQSSGGTPANGVN